KANDLPDNLKPLRLEIEAAIPVGGPGIKGSWKQSGFSLPKQVENAWVMLVSGYEEILKKHPQIRGGATIDQLGTLGTGNHFIEVCLDADDTVWVMLHSGSRGVGNRIATYFIERAKKDMRRLMV